jgi:hypothetical protein
MLEVESGISTELIFERGYFTAADPEELRKLGFADYQLRVPALVVPMYGPEGSLASHQIRPDNPRMNDEGKLVKYETPSNSGVVLDCHPSNATRLKDPEMPLWITEGVRKGDSGASRGLVVVALQGVWCWQRSKTPLSEWNQIPLANRTVYLAFDADIVDKPPVRQALEALTDFLWDRKALVHVVPLEEIEEDTNG